MKSGSDRIVVVGNGMAGSRFVTEMRARDRAVPLTVFGAEPQQPYNRVLLSNVLAGAARPDQIGLVDPAWYDRHDVDARLGVEVVKIDRDQRLVYAADGSVTEYGTLVVATGSVALVPPIPGTEGGLPAGALAFRTLEDCHRILELADRAERAVVVGGGLLGIEAARGLAGRGLDVTVLHLAGHLMERQLDQGAGRVLARTLARLGIRTRVEANVSALRTGTGPDGERRAVGVELADGEFLPGDLVIMACGVRPDVRLAREAGLEVDRGIVVDEMLRSVTDPSVRAIGECSQYGGMVYGLVAPAWEQATILADLLAGTDAAARFTGARQITRLKAASVDLAAMGETHHTDDDPEVEVVQFADPARGTYKKVVIKDDRLIGAILLGETSTAGTLTQLYDRESPLPSDRLSLLFPGINGAAVSDSPVRMPDAATVCHCNNVSKGQIRACWERGARTADDVARQTRASTGCGSCRDAVEGIVAWLDEQESAPTG
ncbi:FAD-dependent oxidoreductase [Thermomonospora cellulosilytica]|uniref:Assimilatory nitrate reductase electron transfer subunit n=1 Tax=Thermomonospora cellulosilytica TaxID=1411118 RepID=A0A7W3RA98_9ACTN|nr:FAD-dependent oxidoreductase [Thermomonospora cellulosilytica]MBA9005641.1 assimilatory nitrate reductase electron transfer subunit [Thermomonospora cellulosilytica]